MTSFEDLGNCSASLWFITNYVVIKFIGPIIAGSLESANWSILAVRNLFKEVVGKKSGFYVNEIFKNQ